MRSGVGARASAPLRRLCGLRSGVAVGSRSVYSAPKDRFPYCLCRFCLCFHLPLPRALNNRSRRRGRACPSRNGLRSAVVVGSRSVCSAPKVNGTAKRRGNAERLLRSEGQCGLRSAVAVGARSVCSAPKANTDCEAPLSLDRGASAPIIIAFFLIAFAFSCHKHPISYSLLIHRAVGDGLARPAMDCEAVVFNFQNPKEFSRNKASQYFAGGRLPPLRRMCW